MGKATVYNREIQPEFDTTLLLEYLQTRSESRFLLDYYSHIRSFSHRAVKNKTIIKTINNNYLEADIYEYNNPVHFHREYNPVLGKCTLHLKPYGPSRNFTIDLDNTPYATFLDVREAILLNKAPMPQKIIQTSPFNWHLLYLGDDKVWTHERRLDVHLLVAGGQVRPTSNDDLRKLLAGGYVDYNYYRQNPRMSKIRVPGSLNVMSGHFVVQYWDNPNYNINEVVATLDKFSPKKIFAFPQTHLNEGLVCKDIQKPIIVKKSTNVFKISEDLREKITEAILDAYQLNKRSIKKLVQYFLENLGFLNQGSHQIPQSKLGKLIGLEQHSVSYLLKRLVEKEILRIVDGNFSKGTKSKTYALTFKFKEKIFYKSANTTKYDYTHPYTEDGTANDQRMHDMRRLMLDKGYSLQEAIEFVVRKHKDRPGRQKTESRVRSDMRTYGHRLYRKFPERFTTIAHNVKGGDVNVSLQR